jgi:hypothetical protein
MAQRKRLPRSVRKYIRKEKARIRREVLDITKRERLIEQLYQKILEKYKIKKDEDKRNLQIGNKNGN